MPYIRPELRGPLDKHINLLMKREDHDIGSINYMITRICHEYIKHKGPNYARYNDIMGVLSCVGNEMYRRKIAEYEDLKIEENGDVV